MSMDRTEFEKQVDALYAARHLDAFGDMAMRMNVPFFWSKGRGAEAEVLQNGTMCMVDTGTRKIGITCDHVYSEYLADRERHTDLEAQFGGNTIAPEQRLIARDEALDLATFDVPEVFLAGSFGYYYHTPPVWPARPVAPDDVVCYGGYPQSLRSTAGGQVHTGFQWFATQVNEVKESMIVLEPGVGKVYWPGHRGEKINDTFGGQSGGPVYRVIDAKKPDEPVDRLELVGFIYNKLGNDLVLAKHSRHVQPDGTLVP